MAIRIGFIGAGNMARAMVAGIMKLESFEVAAFDISADALLTMREIYEVHTFDEAIHICAWADILVLAIKPQNAMGVISDIAKYCENKAVVSIVTGLSVQKMTAALPKTARVLRVMPNTPALIGQGMSALCSNTSLNNRERQAIERIFEGIGRFLWVDESRINAITALSGSGPAYVYMMIEAMIEAGIREGLSFAQARELAAQTVSGAAQMVLASGEHPAALRNAVTSPAGTTAEGLNALEQGKMRGTIINAIRAAKMRADELGG